MVTKVLVIEASTVQDALATLPKMGETWPDTDLRVIQYDLANFPRPFWDWLFRKPIMWAVECLLEPVPSSSLEDVAADLTEIYSHLRRECEKYPMEDSTRKLLARAANGIDQACEDIGAAKKAIEEIDRRDR